ncbi:DUF4383 domain-containing protein [Mycobacterium sp. DBP42]|nr:DUF4383 domain-containing protein [Mycobacterium sp. DBP42]
MSLTSTPTCHGIPRQVPGQTARPGWNGPRRVFPVTPLQAVALTFGVVGVIMARQAGAARAYLIGGGLIYAVLRLYGLFIDRDSSANFIPVNTADNWLHFGSGAGHDRARAGVRPVCYHHPRNRYRSARDHRVGLPVSQTRCAIPVYQRPPTGITVPP